MILELCCDWMRNGTRAAGEQGISVIAFRDNDYRCFRPLTRWLSESQARTFRELTSGLAANAPLAPLFRDGNGHPLGVTMSVSVPLKYCPSCGTNLPKLIRRQLREFDELAIQHTRFMDG